MKATVHWKGGQHPSEYELVKYPTFTGFIVVIDSKDGQARRVINWNEVRSISLFDPDEEDDIQP